MHILHLINNARRGGAGFVVLPLVKELRKAGHTFTIAYLQGPENLKEEYQRLGAKTVLLGKNPFRILKLLIGMLSNREEPISLIHTHLVQASLIGRFIGLIFRIPVMTTRHYLERGKPNHPLYILEDWTTRFSTKVVAISSAVQKHLIESNYVSIDKCAMVYNPIDLKIFDEVQESNLKEKTNLVFNGRFLEVKGIRYLLEAFDQIASSIPAAKLVLLGRYEDNNPVMALIDQHQYQDRIIIKGFVPRAEIIDELSRARIYIQPSLSEGLGISALEAMGLRCPCIFSDVGGLVELSQEGQTAILFPSRDSAQLAIEILDLWNNIEKSELLGAKAKKYVYRNFDSRIIAAQYLKYYQVLNKGIL